MQAKTNNKKKSQQVGKIYESMGTYFWRRKLKGKRNAFG
jgi:hypothetical protein